MDFKKRTTHIDKLFTINDAIFYEKLHLNFNIAQYHLGPVGIRLHLNSLPLPFCVVKDWLWILSLCRLLRVSCLGMEMWDVSYGFISTVKWFPLGGIRKWILFIPYSADQYIMSMMLCFSWHMTCTTIRIELQCGHMLTFDRLSLSNVTYSAVCLYIFHSVRSH